MGLLLALLACSGDPEPKPRAATDDTAVVESFVPLAPLAATGAGPYSPGVWTVSITDPRGKVLVVEVWYPADPAPDAPKASYGPTTITGTAVRNAPPLRGAFPVVAFSHGLGAVRYQSPFLCERLASHGFVVVSPDHPKSTMFDLDEDALVEVFLERPDDLRYTVDGLRAQSSTPDSFIEGVLGDGDYAAVGHSFGAITVMSLGGGSWYPQGVSDWCAENGGLPCWYFEDIDPNELSAHGGPDPRVLATVPMAPGMAYAFTPDDAGLPSVARPLVLGATRDTILGYEREVLPVYDGLTGPRALATFHDAGHYAFSDLCTLAPFFADECAEADDGFIDLALAQEATNQLVTAWLREAFELQVPGDAELLDPAAWGDDITLTVDED